MSATMKMVGVVNLVGILMEAMSAIVKLDMN